MDAVFRGGLEPVIDVTWPLSRAGGAHRRHEEGKAFGKIVFSAG
jgi:NADPH:quinone reductase-like Zn-dependent oxidoreductase